MSFLIRKIDGFNKWSQKNILKGEQPSADAITHCLKTKQNALSFWLIDDESQREEGVLAIAAQFDHLDSIDILLIDLSLIKKKRLSLLKNPGLTPYTDFIDKHFDVTNLDYLSLGAVAEVIVESIRQTRHKMFRESELVEILSSGVRAGKVQWSKLKPHVQKKIPQDKDNSTTIERSQGSVQLACSRGIINSVGLIIKRFFGRFF